MKKKVRLLSIRMISILITTATLLLGAFSGMIAPARAAGNA
jgi:hypothetical protein